MLNCQHLKDVYNSASQRFLNDRSVAMQSHWYRSHCECKGPIESKGMERGGCTEIPDSRFQATLRRYRQLFN